MYIKNISQKLPLRLTEEVATALAEGQAVVALESTIITHGMSFPANVAMAVRVEETIRAAGAVPATIALLDGQLRAGLPLEDIERLGKAGQAVAKASVRDLGALLARRLAGATTVAATMRIARLAGIGVFATGGIGGVHRGAAASMDISADLQELGHTPVAVVTAGAKAILDLPLTLEYLETLGVPVYGYQTDDFPAFYSRRSGLQVDYRFEDVADMAEAIRAHWALGGSGLVVANPIPQAYELPMEIVEPAIQSAMALAADKQVRGKALTPFLLQALEQLTEGSSLAANIELVLNNARLGASLALALQAKTAGQGRAV
jgi:pseudouridine-5'-phosphate glycosidase